MDEIRFAIKIEDRAEGKPRLIGTLMSYNERAKDRAEVFEPGSLKWDAGGIVLNRMHIRGAPILRFKPIESEGRVLIDAEIPSTVAGADALAEVKSGLFRGLSIEFRAVKQTFVLGVRRISEAVLSGAALVDAGSYQEAKVEARAKAARDRDERDRWKEFIL